MKNLKEIKLMMERLESPRWTDTEYQKRVKQLKEENLTGPELDRAAFAAFANRLSKRHLPSKEDEAHMKWRGFGYSPESKAELRDIAKILMKNPKSYKGLEGWEFIKNEIEKASEESGGIKNLITPDIALQKLVKTRLIPGCKEQPNNDTWKCDVINDLKF